MKKILVVDGNSILNRAFYGIRPLTTATGLFTNAVYGMVTILCKHIEAVAPDAMVTAFDLKAPTFRHKEYSGYKANRKPMPEELAVQLPYAKKVVEYLGSRVVTLEGWEADDILGTLAGKAEQSGGEWKAYILTGDRDSLQLISENATILLATNSDTITFDRAKFVETYGISPEQFVDVKALMGDTSDNIPGIAGIGEKTALKLISEFGSLDKLYENFDNDGYEAKVLAKGVRSKLESGRDSAYLSKRLAQIDKNAPIGFELNDLPKSELMRSELLELFRELEFSGLIKRLGLEGGAVQKKIEFEEKRVEIKELLTEIADSEYENCAICVENGFSICFDGRLVFSVGPIGRDELSQLLNAVFDRGYRTIVYDSKAFYHRLADERIVIKSTFDSDAMLTAYVLDPSENDSSPEHLMLKYLEITKKPDEEFNAAELFKLEDEMERRIRANNQERLLSEIEIPLAKVLCDMEEIGFKVDLDRLEEFSNRLAEQADALRERICMYAGEDFNVNSPKQLGEILFDKLGLPSGKKNSRGYSTGADVLEKLAPFYPIVGDILEYRQLTKLKSTYGDGLAKAADKNGVIHTSFNQTITATGRLSSTEPNLQNIPVRTELGREMRRFFVPAEPGRVLIDADYSQIELRILAHISGDETMLEAFRNGIDIHAVTASQAFGVPLEAVTPEMRKRAKAVNFGIVYGISDYSLAQDIGVSKKQAANYISSYLAKYPSVEKYLQEVIEKARTDGYVTTMFGRRRYIPEINSPKKTLRSFGERVAMNSPIQGSAADIIKIAMINVARALNESPYDAKLILQVHDELIVDSSREDAEAVRELLKNEMESSVELSLPLTVSTAIGESWYDCKD